jgi:serine/threonine protein kinase
VLLVRLKRTQDFFAVKMLNKKSIIEHKYIEQAMSEKSILQSIRHPFVVRVYSLFQTLSQLFLVITYAGGGDLSKRLRLRRRFLEEEARFYACEVLLAIEYLHSKRIVYRDLKPENILLTMDGHVLLTDFGLSRPLKVDAESMAGIAGTPAYMAPEMLLKGRYDHCVDWWSFGILLYEMLEGRPPFVGESTKVRTALETARRGLTNAFRRPSSTPSCTTMWTTRRASASRRGP